MLKDYEVAIVRIIGNELPPRHAIDSNLEQLQFILKQTPSHPRVKKIWLLNRIVDKAQEKALIEMLNQHNCTYEVLPFDVSQYKEFIERKEYVSTCWYKRAKKELLAKIGFIIDINRARNKAMDIGSKYADWVIPLDGGCCLNEDAMAQMLNRVAQPKREVYALPTYRLVSNNNYVNFDPKRYPMHESMLLMKANMQAPFDETIPYGLGEKLEAMFRFFPRSAMKRTAYAYLIHDPDYHAGYVVRLSSGNDRAEGRYRSRVKLRMEGLSRLAEKVDRLANISNKE